MEELRNNEKLNENSEVKDSDKEFTPGVKKRFFFTLGVIVCLIALGIAYKLQTFGRFVSQDRYEYYKELENNYGKYNEILRMIGEDPIATSNPGAIDDAKLKEMVASIGDPYAEYFTKEEYAEFEKNYASEYVGVGIGLMQDEDRIVIMNVFEGSPAEDAGIISGDVLLKVNGVAPKDSDEAVSLITGEVGGAVEILIDREGTEMAFNMHRAKIDYDSVSYYEVEEADKVGYIEIMGFREDTAKDFKLAVRDLKHKGCDKFIIDLRNNGGGLTDESIEIADYLLPACKIMSEKSKNGDETVYNSKASSADLDFVVLTNINTASASEILAGALQDNKAGLIIGQKTYGKGVTQLTRKFKDGSAVKLTITEYFRPSGATVNGEGITPDIETEEGAELEAAFEELAK